MKLIDKRETKQTIPFDNLNIGDCYQDKDGYICIKTGFDRCMYLDDSGGWSTTSESRDAAIIPLKATITVER